MTHREEPARQIGKALRARGVSLEQIKIAGVLGLGLLGVAGALYLAISGWNQPVPIAVAPAATCDDGCLAKKYRTSAEQECKPLIERRAKFDTQWKDGSMFETFLVHGDVIMYDGDNVKFQNGFGAWTTMVYHCDFDTKSRTATLVSVREGWLR